MPSLDTEIVRVGAMNYLGQLSPLEPRDAANCFLCYIPLPNSPRCKPVWRMRPAVCEEWRERWAEPRMELDKTSGYDVVDGEAIKLILRIFFFSLVIQKHS